MHEENVTYEKNASYSAQKIRDFSAKKEPINVAPGTPQESNNGDTEKPNSARPMLEKQQSKNDKSSVLSPSDAHKNGKQSVLSLTKLTSVDTAYESRKSSNKTVSFISLFFFCFSMVLDSILDGIAIGVFQHVEEIVFIAVSFILHRIPESFAVGTAYKANN